MSNSLDTVAGAQGRPRGHALAPMMTVPIPPEQFLAAECPLAEPFDLFVELYRQADGRPCVGYAYFNDGHCGAFRTLSARARVQALPVGQP